jgi:hypothetical protein
MGDAGIQTQNFIAGSANHVLSVEAVNGPVGWSGLMPNLFFHQRYPPKMTYRPGRFYMSLVEPNLRIAKREFA